jgi:hypothetical protein
MLVELLVNASVDENVTLIHYNRPSPHDVVLEIINHNESVVCNIWGSDFTDMVTAENASSLYEILKRLNLEKWIVYVLNSMLRAQVPSLPSIVDGGDDRLASSG